MANSYEIPSWAGKPPTGLHLDVLKDDKLVQKLMVDEKKCYLFGRNAQMNDFCIDHASCSRVHAAFVYHKHLNIAYLVDLGSTHGTFIGTLRLEAHKPTQLHVNSTFHFGASTRCYILRERPTVGQGNNIMEDIPMNDMSDGALLGLPECQTELDNLTEYNTAHNRRISMLGIVDDNLRKNKSRKRRNVTFNDEEIIINPEDIDPNVGRFRNLIQTTVIPLKRARYDVTHMGILSTHPTTISNTNSNSHNNNQHIQTTNQIFQHSLQEHMRNLQNASTNAITTAGAGTGAGAAASATGTSVTTSAIPITPIATSLYHGLPAATHDNTTLHGHNQTNDIVLSPLALGSKLGLLLPNPAPDVTPLEMNPTETAGINVTTNQMAPSMVQKLAMANAKVYYDDNGYSTGNNSGQYIMEPSNEPPKKKYAKEAWPGRKPKLATL